MEVWLHCGLRFKPAGLGGVGCTPPLHGNMAEGDWPRRHNRYIPLRRIVPGQHASIIATAVPALGLHRLEYRWLIELMTEADTDHPLRFCAATRVDANAWVRELQLRLAPLTVVSSRCVPTVIGGDDNVTGICAGRVERVNSRLDAARAVAGRAVKALIAKYVLTGAVGTFTIALHPGAYSLAVGAAPWEGRLSGPCDLRSPHLRRLERCLPLLQHFFSTSMTWKATYWFFATI